MSSNLIAAINTIRLICADSEFHQRHAGAHGVRDHRPRGCSSFAVTTRNEKLRQPCSHLSLTRNWHTRIHTHTHTHTHTYIHTYIQACSVVVCTAQQPDQARAPQPPCVAARITVTTHCRRSYLQGMNYLAAFLLLVAGDEESAFWLLAASA